MQSRLFLRVSIKVIMATREAREFEVSARNVCVEKKVTVVSVATQMFELLHEAVPVMQKSGPLD